MALTDPKIRQAKAQDKTYRLANEKGLYLEVRPNDSRYWRHKYRYNQKEKLAAYGVYPEVSLKKARQKGGMNAVYSQHLSSTHDILRFLPYLS